MSVLLIGLVAAVVLIAVLEYFDIHHRALNRRNTRRYRSALQQMQGKYLHEHQDGSFTWEVVTHLDADALHMRRDAARG